MLELDAFVMRRERQREPGGLRSRRAAGLPVARRGRHYWGAIGARKR